MLLPRVLTLSVAVVLTVGISACRTSSSGVLTLGPEAYTISANAPPVRGGSAEAQRIAFSEANEFCAKTGKEIHVIELKVSSYNAEVIFRCIDKGEPKFQQP